MNDGVTARSFPLDWPVGCPPTSAQSTAGDVFRLVSADPPVTKDLQTHHETGRLPRADPCLRCGLSVFRNLRDALHQRQLLPKLGKFVARGTLAAGHGKSALTPGTQPTHTTWWPYIEVSRHTLFVVVADIAVASED